ncbi:MAG: carboxyl-terminal protease, partial [Flavobacteriaceae bacterium]|nr:carboxyl-terminal protease [Flavobacteriaceae bacterium]
MRKYVLLFLLFIGFWSCSDDLDDNFSPLTDVTEFVYRAMNAFYLYKDEVPVLANDAFASQGDLQTFLSGFNTPNELFGALLYDPANVDRFSAIVENFLELENSFAGVNETTGMRFLLVRISGSDDIFGVVTYVLPNSPAASAGVNRGMIFTSVSNTPLTINSNFNALFNG